MDWYRFFALWQRLKYKIKKVTLLLYTDVFEDYPLIKHLGKKTNEAFSLGWYSGFITNSRKLMEFKRSKIFGKTEIKVLPSVVILFNTFHSVTKQFLKELSVANIYYVLFASLTDYAHVLNHTYAIFMTKNYANYYYYYYLLYKAFHNINSFEDSFLGFNLSRTIFPVRRRNYKKYLKLNRNIR
jgi:hypothetical protein